MTNFNKRFAFTLSELLLSLIIVGVVAIITVPVLINNVQKKLFATQIKNFSAEIEQFAQDQMITHRTRDLFDTDFGTPSKLLTDGHFSIAKICTADNSLKDCWKTTVTGKDKITYKKINGVSYKIATKGLTVVLKNGVMFRYTLEEASGENYALFLVDVNGNDKPNIIGRDAFAFYINSKGHIESYPLNSPNYTHSNRVKNCSANSPAQYCYSALVDNNWKMDY